MRTLTCHLLTLSYLILAVTNVLTCQAQIDTLKPGTPIQLGFKMPAGSDKVTIPFDVHNNLIVVKVLLNNTLPLRFILDTGVRTTVLTEKTFTDLLNLTYSRKLAIRGLGGEKLVDAYVANNVTITLGGIIGKGHALLVLEEDLLQLKSFLGVNVHGIIGYELFSRFVTDINFKTRQITFYNPDTYNKKRGFVEIPLFIEDTKPYINANVLFHNGTKFNGKFMIDTGSSHSLLFELTSDSSIIVDSPYIESNLGRGLGGNIFGKVARIQELCFSEFRFKEVITTYPEEEHYNAMLSSIYRNGTLGGGIITRLRVVFDYIHGYLYLKKSSSYRKPFEFNLSGLIIRSDGLRLNDYYIDGIREDCSAFKAGIEVGDKLVSVNGKFTNTMDLSHVIGLLNSKVDKHLKLVIIRDNKKISKSFMLERSI